MPVKDLLQNIRRRSQGDRAEQSEVRFPEPVRPDQDFYVFSQPLLSDPFRMVV